VPLNFIGSQPIPRSTNWGLTDLVDGNGSATVYSVYAMENGDKFFARANLVIENSGGITEFPDGTTGTGYFVGLADYTKGAGKGFTIPTSRWRTARFFGSRRIKRQMSVAQKAFLKEQSPSSVARIVLLGQKAMERSLAHGPFRSQPARTYTLTTLST
jgi:hypothetical protein